MRKGLAAFVALVVTFVLVGSSQASAANRYVGLGDSYAAGPLIPLQLQPFGCLKSNNNYIHIVQRGKASPSSVTRAAPAPRRTT